ncbi:hypothetical protein EOI86_06885 [Hwanghaeella grinnelliae]|uniref:Class I SAM-dependent methyltransferase n=1 Tax=Hwanghaeella grinnelliae TaxID=2500179 RepID=A0A3S2WUS7_9PROT|nr:methyltransferase domain-containing protein [Hwanghaeella grinnelliae]RVU38980.1 hypothetical protein EOI86_06885 [Hwanghaeella grinnelliae]
MTDPGSANLDKMTGAEARGLDKGLNKGMDAGLDTGSDTGWDTGTVLQRLAALTLVAAALQPPWESLWQVGAIAVAAVLIFGGRVQADGKRWLVAMGLVALAIFGRLFLPGPQILEGHNVLSVWQRPAAVEKVLPQALVDRFDAIMRADYPAIADCDTSEPVCRDARTSPTEPYAWSNASVWDAPEAPYSRIVSAIDFDSVLALRAGFTDTTLFNWYKDHRYIRREAMPYFVVFQWPEDVEGWELCWRGRLYWETEIDSFTDVSSEAGTCRTITADDVGRRIAALDTGRSIGLEITLVPNVLGTVKQVVKAVLAFLCALIILVILVRPDLRRVFPALGLLGLSTLVVCVVAPDFLTATILHFGGGDGLTHESYGQTILRLAQEGALIEALKGVEAVYYFMPGLRYFRAMENLFFGETDFGMLLALLALPFVVFWICRLFLPLYAAVAATIAFTATTVGKYLGFSFSKYIEEAALGHAEPLGYTAFFAAIVLAVARYDRLKAVHRQPYWPWLLSGLAFAFAVFMRPNLAPGVAVFCLVLGLAMLKGGHLRLVLAWAVGIGAVLWLPFHNWFYGDAFVLLTAAADIDANMLAPPQRYIDALAAVFQGEFNNAAVAQITAHVSKWLSPFRFAVLLACIYAVFIRRGVPWQLRALGAAALAQQCVLMFYHPNGRYEFLAWFLTTLTVLGVFWPAFERRWLDRLSGSRAMERLAGWLGLANRPSRAHLARLLEGPIDGMTAVDAFKTWCRPFVSPLPTILARLPRNARIFDIGTGNGALLYLASETRSPAELRGSDCADRSAVLASLKEWRNPPQFILTGKNMVPDLAGAEVVTLIDVLHHVDAGAQQAFLEGLFKGMDPGATLLVADIDAGRPFRRFMNQIHDLILARQWVNPLPVEKTLSMLRQAGFETSGAEKEVALWYAHYVLSARVPD